MIDGGDVFDKGRSRMGRIVNSLALLELFELYMHGECVEAIPKLDPQREDGVKGFDRTASYKG